MNFWSIVVAISHLSFEKLNAKNSKHQQEQDDNQEHIEKSRNGQNERIDHRFNAYIKLH